MPVLRLIRLLGKSRDSDVSVCLRHNQNYAPLATKAPDRTMSDQIYYTRQVHSGI